MEGGENILDAINYEEEDDVEMVDVEEGELVEEEEQDHNRNCVAATQDHNLIHESDSKNINQKPKPLSKNRKRKNKRKRKALGGSDAPINIDRFLHSSQFQTLIMLNVLCWLCFTGLSV
jgi:phosphorylated adapter RNA export protein